MIDITCETVLTFREASHRLPRKRSGKPIHVHTFYRWATRGCRGVRLESLMVGGSRCTSIEAMQRFFGQLSGEDGPGGGSVKKVLQSRQVAHKTLLSAGIADMDTEEA